MQDLIAFIGGGNMAASLIGGLLAAGHPAGRIHVAEPNPERRDWLHGRYGVAVHETAAQALPGAQVVLLAVKPQQMAAALSGLQPDADATIVSIAAGVRVETLRRALGGAVHYVRTMPNTPALFGAGVTGLYAPEGTPQAARDRAEYVLEAAGKVCWIASEELIDAVTALSGSGPAYYFLVTEVLREAGIALGLPADVAGLLAEQTLIGSARMVQDAGTDVVTLRAQVTSKGGTTEAAVRHLENAGLRRIFGEALTAAARRGRELGDELARSGDT